MLRLVSWTFMVLVLFPPSNHPLEIVLILWKLLGGQGDTPHHSQPYYFSMTDPQPSFREGLLLASPIIAHLST